MTEPQRPSLAKWPFILGDLLLVAVAVWIVQGSPDPYAFWPLVLTVAAIFGGAWICVTPFVIEYRGTMRFAEADRLASTVSQIQKLENLARNIEGATAHWQTVQDESARTVQAAQEVGQRIGQEARAFADFLTKANEAEKGHLRLEVEKLRRAEGEWLQVIVRLLDHIYALYQAGVRSGQPSVRDQLSHFQNACRELVRRMGLIVYDAHLNEPFDEARHQLIEGDGTSPEDASVTDVIATGFTFQGQVLRRAVVSVTPNPQVAAIDPGVEEGIVAQNELLDWDGTDSAPKRV